MSLTTFPVSKHYLTYVAVILPLWNLCKWNQTDVLVCLASFTQQLFVSFTHVILFCLLWFMLTDDSSPLSYHTTVHLVILLLVDVWVIFRFLVLWRVYWKCSYTWWICMYIVNGCILKDGLEGHAVQRRGQFEISQPYWFISQGPVRR
jgi:hypothetical protein